MSLFTNVLDFCPKATLPILSASSLILLSFYIAKSVSVHISRRKFAISQSCQPIQAVYPSRWFGTNFIFDNAKHFKERNYLNALSKQFQDVGWTHEVRMLGGASIWTIEPENLKTMLSVRFKDYSLGNRPEVMGPLLGRGVFVTDGDEWQHSRSLLRPSFTRDQVANLTMIEQHVQNLLRLIPPDGETVELQQLFYRFTMDSSTEFLFGESTDTLLEHEGGIVFAQAFKYSLQDVSAGMRLGPMHKLRRQDRKALQTHRICREYVDKYVDQALAYREKLDTERSSVGPDGAERKTFLTELALATNDRGKMRDELMSLLLAGRDTTASLIGSVIFCLSRSPLRWQKVRKEVQDVLQGRLPTYEELRNLQYVKYCINEALRLYPPVPNNAKMATTDTILPRGGGPDGSAPVFVPKGSMVIYTVFALHRRKDLWGDDAEEFRPERWGNHGKFAWEYLPFNAGPRICLGQQYALTEAWYLLVRMAQEFESIDSRDSEPWAESLELTVSSGNGVKVAVRRERPSK